MKGFGSGAHRSPGARPMKGAAPRGARPQPVTRAPDAELGRSMRGLMGPSPSASGSGRGRGDGGTARASGAGGWGAALGGRRLSRAGGRARGIGRIATPARAAGLLGMLASGFLFTLATGPTAFGVSRAEVPTLAWTDDTAVLAALGDLGDANAFRLDTQPMESALGALPGVAAAEVSVRLPDAALVVSITERRPVLAWQIRDRRFIADSEGVIFAEVAASAPLPEGVAVVDDRRQGAISLHAVGRRLDPVDLDVATRLGSLVPGDVGSDAAALRVTITDAAGFTVSTPRGWTAVFGFYSPATRPAEMIPGQVRLLRSLLVGREADVLRIILASETDGTYVPRATPRPTAR